MKGRFHREVLYLINFLLLWFRQGWVGFYGLAVTYAVDFLGFEQGYQLAYVLKWLSVGVLIYCAVTTFVEMSDFDEEYDKHWNVLKGSDNHDD